MIIPLQGISQQSGQSKSTPWNSQISNFVLQVLSTHEKGWSFETTTNCLSTLIFVFFFYYINQETSPIKTFILRSIKQPWIKAGKNVALLLSGRLEYSRKIEIISLSVIDLYKSMAKNKYALDFPVHISNVHIQLSYSFNFHLRQEMKIITNSDML